MVVLIGRETMVPAWKARVRTCVVRIVFERGWSSAYEVWGKKRDIFA